MTKNVDSDSKIKQLEKLESDNISDGNETMITTITGKLIGNTVKDRREAQAGGEVSQEQETAICMEILGTESKGDIYLIDEKLTIGREFADIEINDTSLSSLHCTLRCQRGVVSIIDNNSSNGTYVDGRRIKAGRQVIVGVNDKVLLGRVEIGIVALDPKDSRIKINQALSTKSISFQKEKGLMTKVKGLFGNKKNEGTGEFITPPQDDFISPVEEELRKLTLEEKINNLESNPVKSSNKKKVKIYGQKTDSSGETVPSPIPPQEEINTERSTAFVAAGDDINGTKENIELGDDLKNAIPGGALFRKNLSKDQFATPVAKLDGDFSRQSSLESPSSLNIKNTTTKAKKNKKFKVKVNHEAAPFHIRLIGLLNDFFIGQILLFHFYDNKDFSPLSQSLMIKWTTLSTSMGLPQQLVAIIEKTLPLILLIFLWKMATSLIFGVSAGQFIIGIKASRSFFVNRMVALFRIPIGFITAPFILFDLPCIFHKKTLKEVVTFTTLTLAETRLRLILMLITTPLLFVLSNSHMFLIEKFNLMGLGKNFIALELKPQKVGQAYDEEISTSSRFELTAKIPLEGSLFFLPSIQLINKQSKTIARPYLYYFDDDNDEYIRFFTDGHFDWRKVMEKITNQLIFFSQSNRELHHLAVGNLDKSELLDNELLSFISSGLNFSVPQLLDYLGPSGFQLNAFSTLKEQLQTLFPGINRLEYKILKMQGRSFLALTPRSESSLDIKNLILIPIIAEKDKVKIYKIEFSTAASLSSFINFLSLKVDWSSLANEEEDDGAITTFSILDKLPSKSISLEEKKVLLVELIKRYNDVGGIIVQNRNEDFAKSIVKELGRLMSYLEHAGANTYSQFILDLKKINTAIEERDSGFFQSIEEDKMLESSDVTNE